MKVCIKFGLSCVKDVNAIRFNINPTITRYDDPNMAPKSNHSVTAFIMSGSTVVRETVSLPETLNKEEATTQIRLLLGKIVELMGSVKHEGATVLIPDSITPYAIFYHDKNEKG